LTVFNLARDTGPGPRSPGPAAAGPPPGAARRPRVLKTRRGTLDVEELDGPSTDVHAVPTEPADDGHDLPELVDRVAVAVEPDVDAIFSSRNSSGLRSTTSTPRNNTQRRCAENSTK